MKNSLELLVDKCQRWGTDVHLIQGPGGNFSWKNQDKMWIKSSGFLLKDVSLTSGLTELDLDKAAFAQWSPDFRDPSDQNEKEYASKIYHAMVNGSDLRPSMEAGMHVLLPQSWVFHTHSCSLTLLGVLASDHVLKQKFFDEFEKSIQIIEIPFLLPGFQLSAYLSSLLREGKIPTQSSLLICMKNHGAIWAGDNLEELEEIFESVEEYLFQLFKFGDYSAPHFENTAHGLDFSHWPDFYYSSRAYFPDYSIFFSNLNFQPAVLGKVVKLPEQPFSDVQRISALEIIFFQALLSTLCLKLAGKSIELSNEIHHTIISLETEKLRKKQILDGA